MIFDDANIIYKAVNKAIKASDKKRYSTQLYQVNKLLYTAMLQRDLSSGQYKPSKGNKFTLHERGKTRLIASNTMQDKVVNHIICDEILTPSLKRYLIHDNSASQKGKGVSFHRRRFEQHLRKFKDGYILLGDFKGFYANIDHEICKKVLDYFLSRSNIDKNSLRTCKKILDDIFETFDKGIDIGNQISQNIGIALPYKFDNFIKIKHGIKYYGRYSDDFYIIDKSREKLKNLLKELKEIACGLGIILNEKKTKIIKLSGFFRHLQNGYSIAGTGRLIIKINPKAVTRERRRLKAYKRLLDNGKISLEKIENNFKSWLCNNYKKMSRKQIFNIMQIYKNL
ncbi:MAG: hypothetical protein IJ859_11610, partial [Synergistaceae bacterium]|nr:hypothetical protein [Synergistaceae bacterium]